MTVELPSDGWVFLYNFLRFETFPLSLILLGLLFYAGLWRENESVFSDDKPFPELSFGFLILMLGTALTFDGLVPFVSKGSLERLFLLARNCLVLMVGMGCVVFLRNNPLTFRNVVGRVTPPARLLLLGLTSFVLTGLGFWVVSLVSPIRIELSQPDPLSAFPLLHATLSVVLIPLTEELLFRFYLYGYLRKVIGTYAGIITTSLLFTVLHGLSAPLLPILAGALVMNVLMEFTRSVVPGLVVHSGFNFLMFYGVHWLTP